MHYFWSKNIKKASVRSSVCGTLFAVLCLFPLIASAQAAPNGITEFIYDFCVGIGGWFLWLGALLLDYSIGMLVIGMGELLRGGIGIAIDNLWMVIRDIFNILFIFGLIYIGFKTILNAGGTDTKRMLGMLIAAALLINFSLYFTKVVVDFSNVAAYQIYQLMDVGEVTAAGGEYKGIAGAFMQYTKLTSFTETDSSARSHLQDAAADSSADGNSMRIIGYGFMVMIFLLITAFVFIAGAILLVVRFIVLIILMIFSPILLLGWVVPKFEGESQKRLKQLINQALIAPAFLFMLYLSLTVLQQLQTNGSFADAMHPANASGTFQLIIYILVVAGFVIASLLVAQQLGAIGADRAMNVGKSAANWTRTRAKNAAIGTGAILGRQTVGRSSNKAQEVFKKWQEKPPEKQTSALGRGLRTGLAWTNLDRSVINTTEKGKSAKFGSSYSFKENQEYDKERQKRVTAGSAEQRREDAISKGVNITKSSAVGPINPEDMDEFAKAMRGLTDKQLTEDLKLEVLTNENVAVHLTEKNIETLEKSGKYSDAQITEIKDVRKKGFTNIATKNTADGSAYNPHRTPEWLAQKGSDEVAKMPKEVFFATEMAPHLTPNMVEAKMKSGGIDDTELGTIRDNIDAAIRADKVTTPGGGAITKQWSNWVNRTTVGPRLGLTEV